MTAIDDDRKKPTIPQYGPILLSRVRFLGDVILTTPLIRAIKKAFPQERLGYMTEFPYSQLLEQNAYLDEIIVFDRIRYRQLNPVRSLFEQYAFIKHLRRHEFNVAIDLFGIPRTAFLLWASGANIRVGIDKRGRRQFYTHRIPNKKNPMDAIEFHLQSLDLLGIPRDGKKTEIFVSPDEEKWAGEFLPGLGLELDRPIIGVHPGATWPAKIWLADRFAELINRLVTKLNLQVLITTAPGDEDRNKKIAQSSKSGVVVANVLNLRQLAATLKQLDAFVCNDCGPMHLAVALGTPTVAIFGPGEPEIWFPYPVDKGNRWVHKEMDCSRCHKDLCDKMDCMRAIEVEDVLKATLAVLPGSAKAFNHLKEF